MKMDPISAESFFIIAGYVGLAVIIVYFFRLSNRKFIERFSAINSKEEEMQKLIDKLYELRAGDNRDVNGKIKGIEQKFDSLVKPQGNEKQREKMALLAKTK